MADQSASDGPGRIRTIDTTRGPAVVDLRGSESSRGLLVLGPGASGQPNQDLYSVADAVSEAGFAVAIVTPPYAVAGRRVPPRGPATDEAWTQVVAALQAELPDQPLISGGRSYGSRVACRTAAVTGSIGVLCLAFPLHPPGQPEKSRLDELVGVRVPTLVIQGRSDPFGCPPEGEQRRVVLVAGDHSLRKEHDQIGATVVSWLAELVG